MTHMSEPHRLELFIESLSRRIAGLHRDSYVRADDLAQEGRIALLKAERNWQPHRGAFQAYAKAVIRREMRAAALGGKGALSGPVQTKRVGIRARRMRHEGTPDTEIAEALGLPVAAVAPVIQLVSPGCSERIE